MGGAGMATLGSMGGNEQQPGMTMGEDGMPVAPEGDDKPLRGFLVTLKVTTPSMQGINLIQNQFLTPLKQTYSEKTVGENRNFYIARTLIVQQSQLKNLPGMAHPQARQGNVPAGQEVIDPLKDPRTNEDMDDDTQAVLLIAVVIDPPPAPKPAPSESADATTN